MTSNLIFRHQCVAAPSLASSRSPTSPMNIGLYIFGHVIINDISYPFNIHSSSHCIRRYKHLKLALPKFIQCLTAEKQGFFIVKDQLIPKNKVVRWKHINGFISLSKPSSPITKYDMLINIEAEYNHQLQYIQIIG